MTIKRNVWASEDILDQIAGLTGLGWTASLLGYLSGVVGYSNTPLVSTQSLLYIGGILFVTTVGLDRINDALSSGSE